MTDFDQSGVLKGVCWTRGQDRGTDQVMCDCVNKQLRMYNCSLM